MVKAKCGGWGWVWACVCVSEGVVEGVGEFAFASIFAVPHPSIGVRTHYRAEGEVWWMRVKCEGIADKSERIDSGGMLVMTMLDVIWSLSLGNCVDLSRQSLSCLGRECHNTLTCGQLVVSTTAPQNLAGRSSLSLHLYIFSIGRECIPIPRGLLIIVTAPQHLVNWS